MSAKKIFISGANRGLGKQLVLLLRKEHPQSQLHITSRGDVNAFSQDLKRQKLRDKLHLYQFNILSEESIKQNAKKVQGQGLIFDTIVANAGYGADFGQTAPSYQIAYNTIVTNTINTIKFIKSLLPNLAPNGRVVIVSSSLGALTGSWAIAPYPQEFIKTVTNPSITEEEIIKISLNYIEAAKKQNLQGYGLSAYCTSKALLNVWARFILPKYLKNDQTYVSLCPGWCSTDMGGQNAPLSPQQGGKRINSSIWLDKIDHSQFYSNYGFVNYETLQ